MADMTAEQIYAILALAAIFVGYLGGRFQDIRWRCLMLRRLLRKNYVVVEVAPAGSRMQTAFVVNADDGKVQVGEQMWVLANGHIYVEGNAKQGFWITKDVVVSETLGIEGAVPVLYVDTSNVKPRNFEDSKAEVSAGEYASNAKKYLANEKAKIMAAQNTTNLIIILILIGALAGAAFSFMAMDKANQLEKKIDALNPPAPIKAAPAPSIVPQARGMPYA